MKTIFCVFAVGLGLTATYVAADDAANGQFAVVDMSGQVASELKDTSDIARESWAKSCKDWKNEIKDLNKSSVILGINCNQPSCNLINSSHWQCMSNGTYQVKTPGTRVDAAPQPPAPPPLPVDHVINVAPPQVIVEATPAPQVGFVWISGYWGWAGTRHIWIPGRWTNERPGYYYVRENWVRRGGGWHLEGGRWDRRR